MISLSTSENLCLLPIVVIFLQPWRAATLCPFGGLHQFPSVDALLKNGKNRTLQAIELESGIGHQWQLWKWASYCASEVWLCIMLCSSCYRIHRQHSLVFCVIKENGKYYAADVALNGFFLWSLNVWLNCFHAIGSFCEILVLLLSNFLASFYLFIYFILPSFEFYGFLTNGWGCFSFYYLFRTRFEIKDWNFFLLINFYRK